VPEPDGPDVSVGAEDGAETIAERIEYSSPAVRVLLLAAIVDATSLLVGATADCSPTAGVDKFTEASAIDGGFVALLSIDCAAVGTPITGMDSESVDTGVETTASAAEEALVCDW
jgi:hypothetical protein